MLILTDSAKGLMDHYFSTHAKEPMRVILAPVCGGERLVVTLKAPEENDAVFEFDGYTVAMDRELLEKARPVSIHASRAGFFIQSGLDLPAGDCGGCTSCG